MAESQGKSTTMWWLAERDKTVNTLPTSMILTGKILFNMCRIHLVLLGTTHNLRLIANMRK